MHFHVGLGPNEKVPSASKLISTSLKKKKNFLIRKQQHRHPFFFSSKRERKRQFHSPGLHRLPHHLKTKAINGHRKKSCMSLRLKKPNIPFQSLTRIVKRPVHDVFIFILTNILIHFTLFSWRWLLWTDLLLYSLERIREAKSTVMLVRKEHQSFIWDSAIVYVKKWKRWAKMKNQSRYEIYSWLFLVSVT